MPHIIKIDQQNPDKDTIDIISKLISKGKTLFTRLKLSTVSGRFMTMKLQLIKYLISKEEI